VDATRAFVGTGSTGFTEITAGYDDTCGVLKDVILGHQIVCWGGNAHGQLGDDAMTDPGRIVLPAGNPVGVSLGHEFTCALSGSGSAMCWGTNMDGQLGNGTLMEVHSPGDVVGLTAGVRGIAT